MSRKIVVVKEQAEQFFEDFLVTMDIQLDNPEGEDKSAVDRVVRAIMYGDLTFNENSEPVYTPWRNASKYKEPITFHERTGEVILASDGKGKNALARQTYSMMGKLCRVEPRTFSQMAGTDIKVCEALFGLLMV